MKTLSKEFDKNNYHHRQIHREGNLAVYQRCRKGSEYPHWEVIRIQYHNGYDLLGKHYPPSEFYPSSTQWGKEGFTCLTKQHAYHRLESMKEENTDSKSSPGLSNLHQYK